MNIIRLRKIRKGDIPRIFKWRNDPTVRKNSFNTKIITWLQHQKYWAGRFSRQPDYSYMIVCDGEGAGVVRLDDKENELHELRKKISELQNHGVRIEPIGFPTKSFEPGTSVKVNLNVLSPDGILQMFGCRDKELEKILGIAMEKGKVESVGQLVKAIDSLESNETENQFLKKRLERIISLVEVIYPEMFAGENNLDEMVKSWFRKIGRASIVDIGALDARVLLFLLDSLSKELLKLFGKQGQGEKPRLLLAIPSIKKVFSLRENLVSRHFEESLIRIILRDTKFPKCLLI